MHFHGSHFLNPALAVLAFCLAGFVQVESAETPDYASEFGRIITKASAQLQEASAKRPFRFTHMNDSLARTAEAALAMAQQGDSENILRLLRRAQLDYPDNSFAVLLEGVIANARGDIPGANRVFERYLLTSRTFGAFDEAFLKWGEFHFLRRMVYEILRSRGVSFEGREKKIRVRIPYEQLIQYGLAPGHWDRWVNIFFLAVIILGGFVWVIALLRGEDMHEFWAAGLTGIYLAVWVSYLTWIFDLAFGLPWGWTRFAVVPVFWDWSCFFSSRPGGCMCGKNAPAPSRRVTSAVLSAGPPWKN